MLVIGRHVQISYLAAGQIRILTPPPPFLVFPPFVFFSALSVGQVWMGTLVWSVGGITLICAQRTLGAAYQSTNNNFIFNTQSAKKSAPHISWYLYLITPSLFAWNMIEKCTIKCAQTR